MVLSPTVLHAEQPPESLREINPKQFKTYSTLKVSETVQLPTNPEAIRFLLNNLDLTCAIIRSWDLERFRAEPLSDGYYRARDGAGLKGKILRIHEGDSRVVFSGRGQYQSRSLPIRLRGNALAEVSFRSKKNGTVVTGTLHVRIENTVIHLMSQVFYPIIKELARNKSEHLTNVAKKTIMRLNDHPDETRIKLSNLDDQFGQRWSQFRSKTAQKEQ